MAKEKWDCVILREICELVNYGYTASAKPESIGPKFLRITDIVPDRVDWVSVPHCRIDERKLSKYRLEKGDIVIARTGATTGYAKRIRENHDAVFASYLVRIRVNAKYDSRYVGFIIESEGYKHFIQQNIGGTAQPQANAQVLTSFPIPLPPASTQRKIAAVLSNYDDLIENNTRRIKILEEMAGTIYREWFVEFRFPGHENVKMVESELGLIPLGWKIVTLSDIVELTRKGLTPSKFPKETFAHYSIPAFDNGGFPTLDAGNTIKSSKYVVPPDCVLMSKLNPQIPRVWLPFINTVHRPIASTEFLIIKPKSGVDCVYLFHLFQSLEFSREFSVQRLGTSRSHQRVSPTGFLGMSILLPNESLLSEFHEKVNPIVKLCNVLRFKNTSLRKTRDLVLPKLISGELDVSELDINIDVTQSGTEDSNFADYTNVQ